MDYLKKLHPHERDSRIDFIEEGHRYIIDGEEGKYTSTTTWIHSHFSHFDAEGTLNKIMVNPRKDEPSYKYYGMTREQIAKQWASASVAGTALHADIEKFYNKVPVENNSIEFQYFLQFYDDHKHLEPYRTEWTVFHEEVKLSGSIDMTFKDPDDPNALIIMDWKNVKEIVYDSFYEKYGLTKHLKGVPDTNFWHYTLQLNTYKTYLEEKYGFRISKMFLVIFHSNQSAYELIPVTPYPDLMRELFDERKQQINNPVEPTNTPLHKN